MISVSFYLFVMMLIFTGVEKFRIYCSDALFQFNTQNKCFISASFFGLSFYFLVVCDFGDCDCALQRNFDPCKNLFQ